MSGNMKICSAVLAVLAVAAISSGMSRPAADARGRLPDAIRDAVREAHPDAEVAAAHRERVALTVYEVVLRDSGARLEVDVAEDGTILGVERSISRSELPAAVQSTLDQAAGGAEVREIERTERLSRIGFVSLVRPEVVFEAEWKRSGREIEIAIAEDGSLLPGDDEDDDDDDDEDDPHEG